MHSPISQELIDAIIDNIQDSKWDLRHCALVCHQWLHPSRRHLFKHIVLFPPCGRYGRRPSDVPYSKRLHQVLLHSPHIVDYIKEVKVYEGQFIREQDWVSTDPTLPLLFRMLVKLERIQFHRLSWSEFPEDLRQSICFVLALPTLSILEIEKGHFNGMGEFKSFLSHAKGLTHLSLTEYVTWNAMHGEMEIKGQVPEPLKQAHLVELHLELYNSSLAQFLDWLISPWSSFTVSRVTTLDIFSDPDGTAINPFLDAVGSSLKLCRLDALQYQPGELTHLFNVNVEMYRMLYLSLRKNS
jgi:hypothetical protein